jgi:hypothetical protein
MNKVSTPNDGSPFTPRQVEILKISIAIMTALLILGILALVYGMTRQASRLENPAKPAAPSAIKNPYFQSLALGQGELKEVLALNGLIILHWKGETGDFIITIGAEDGHELGRIQVPRH